MQRSIPCVMMRGGTSRGLYFKGADLPEDTVTRDAVLVAALGSADPSQIDGAGGGTSVSSKVAIVSPSTHPWAQIDYLFAQVGVQDAVVDTAPSCGNILAGVAPFAIESGFVTAQEGETVVRVHSVNTGALIEAIVQTPGRQVCYEGDTVIDGVPGSAAPIKLGFRNIAGAKTGCLLPTGNARDTVQGVPVTCVDLAMPTVLVPASGLGKTGYETKDELDADADFLDRLESLRRDAAMLMGLGDVSNSVIPKIALLAKPQGTSGVSSRYFVPQNCHAAHAATGAICIAGASLIEGSIAHEAHERAADDLAAIRVEHPKGAIEIDIEARASRSIDAAYLVRTARPIFTGQIQVPATVWPVEQAMDRAA